MQWLGGSAMCASPPWGKNECPSETLSLEVSPDLFCEAGTWIHCKIMEGATSRWKSPIFSLGMTGADTWHSWTWSLLVLWLTCSIKSLLNCSCNLECISLQNTARDKAKHILAVEKQVYPSPAPHCCLISALLKVRCKDSCSLYCRGHHRNNSHCLLKWILR